MGYVFALVVQRFDGRDGFRLRAQISNDNCTSHLSGYNRDSGDEPILTANLQKFENFLTRAWNARIDVHHPHQPDPETDQR